MRYEYGLFILITTHIYWVVVQSSGEGTSSDHLLNHTNISQWSKYGVLLVNKSGGSHDGIDIKTTTDKPEKTTLNRAPSLGETRYSRVLEYDCDGCEDEGVNQHAVPPKSLAVIAMLALIAFLFGVCSRMCDWCKEDIRIEDHKDIRDALEASDHLQPFYDGNVQHALEVHNKRKIRRSIHEENLRMYKEKRRADAEGMSAETTSLLLRGNGRTRRCTFSEIREIESTDKRRQRPHSVHVSSGVASHLRPPLTRSVSLPIEPSTSYQLHHNQLDSAVHHHSGDNIYEMNFENVISTDLVESTSTEISDLQDNTTPSVKVHVGTNQQYRNLQTAFSNPLYNTRRVDNHCVIDNQNIIVHYAPIQEDSDDGGSSAGETDVLMDSGNNNSRHFLASDIDNPTKGGATGILKSAA